MPSHDPCKAILPKPTRELVDRVEPMRRHAGLQLDKLSLAGKMEDQKPALVKVTKTLRDQQLLNTLLARRNDTLRSLGAQRLRMTTRGSLTLHLSRSGALENASIALHPVYGFVYLPGSSVKGLVRAWTETVWAPAQDDKEKAWRRIEKAFGWSPQSENHKFPHKSRSGWRPGEIKPRAGTAAGQLVFHDAWPLYWPRLTLDIINNHHVNYYAGKDDPGDWEDPTLVYFLAIGKGEEFEFAISERKRSDADLLETACSWLRDALTVEGAGAKTAAGYGRFKPVEDGPSATPLPDLPKAHLARASFDLRLITPAFLAGADQAERDCDLRPATLRGLLRWWWRTMHADHLDRDSLKRLETAVWGDAQSGSPVRIAVDSEGHEAPVRYDYKDGSKPKFDFKDTNDLANPPNKKTTQGLFYASYGMDDGGKKRWYRPAGSVWRVTLTAKTGRFGSESDNSTIPLPPDLILQQATAALWLLTQFGGAGSRARKGFGSFADTEVENIASLDDCQACARSFRQICKLPERSNMAHSPALEKMRKLEVTTPWRNPWTALDQLGYAVQAFAQQYAHQEEKKALGLPRKIHGPQRHPIGHQKWDPTTHKPPKNLSVKKGGRHASPIHYHLTRSGDDGLVIRATALWSHRLPNLDESKRMLDNLLCFLETELKKRAQKGAKICQREAKPQEQRQVGPSADLPKANERVEAELLEEKTRKGGWRAKHLDSGLQGPIHDSENVPADAKPGQRVLLTVASANEREIAFRWAEPRPSKKRQGGRRQGKYRSRR